MKRWLRHCWPALLALPACGLAQPANSLKVKGSLELGAEHNSNISITELESAFNQSDTALMVEGALSLEWKPVDKLNVDSGIIYSARNFRRAKAFDLDIAMAYADISYDLSALTLGANYYVARAELGSERFLRLDQYSLYAGRLVSETWYLRAAIGQTDKQFDQFEVRNADTWNATVDSFWFFNQGSSTLILGYAHEREDTLGPEFEYSAHGLRARFHHRFTLRSYPARVQVGIRRQHRDYDNPTLSIQRERSDRQQVTDLRLEVDLKRWFTLVGKVELGDYASNLPSAEFEDNRVSLAMRLSF